MKRVYPISAVVAGVAIVAVLVATNASADDLPASGGIANPTQQQALAANETMRDYILAHPNEAVQPVTTTPARSATPTALSTITGAPTVTPAPVAGKYASGMPWSDGGFFEHSGGKAAEFAAWRGAPLDNIEAFTSRNTWPAQLNDWWADSVPSSFEAGRDDFILSVPLWTDDGDAGTDGNWKDLGTEMAAVDPNGLVRLGWEMNCCFSRATNAAAWKQQFSRAVTLLRTTAPGLQIVFNPNEGGAQNGTAREVESLYVQGKVDIIALDAYDWYEPFTSKASISGHFDKKYGWNYWFRFARERNLPFGIGEFSVYSGSKASGGDNPAFFEATYGWLMDREKADPGSIRFVSLFNESAGYCGCAISATQNPKAARTYKAVITRLRAR